MADVMPNVADGKVTVVHNVPHGFCHIYGWQVKQPLWQMLGHLVINHAGKCYAWAVDGENITIKGAVILVLILRC